MNKEHLRRALQLSRDVSNLRANIKNWNKERLDLTKKQKNGTKELSKLLDELGEQMRKLNGDVL